jgi:2-desacetyl-2-hydroxyethyl bacteriochlorophyllide A dehydrogenase
MRIAVMPEAKRFEIVDEPVPSISPDEVLVRIVACGVCASELDMFIGLAGHADYPWYPGHEVSGTIEQVGSEVKRFRPGDNVAAWVTVRGFADYVAVNAAHCFPAAGVPPEYALGEPLACAVNAVQLTGVAMGDDVAIIGAGFMGHLVHKLVAMRGPSRVIVADARPDALKRALSMGADQVVDVTKDSLVDAVEVATDGRGVDVAIEVTGVQSPLDIIGNITRMSGTIAIVGYHQGQPRSIPLGEWNWKAFRIVNAHFRKVDTILAGMRAAMRLMASGRISLDELVTHRYVLEEISTAFQTAIDKPVGFVKATVVT